MMASNALAPRPAHVYVGAYTGAGRADGISVYRLDPLTGALSHVQTATGVDNPSFLALDPQQRFLYAADELPAYGGQPGGAASAFAVDPQTGQLTLLNTQPTHGAGPCYVSLHPGGRWALVANYGSGSVTVLPVQEDGRLGEASDVVQHQGVGPDPRRQQQPHAHFITPDPAGRYVLACDLGIDKILVYRLDLATGKLAPNEVPYGQVASGEGARHLAFHPTGRVVYVLNEIGSTLSAFAYDGERGTLIHRQTVSTLPADFAGQSHTAQVVVHPNGRFVYASNRGHDSLAIFAIEPATGRLTLVGHQPTQGKTPRNFNLDPSGTFLLAANQNSGTIVTFRVDPASGSLAATGHVVETPAPVCIVFRPA